MVVVLRPHPSTGSRLAKWISHVDPERLEILAADYKSNQGDESRARISAEFSHALDDLCIGSSWKRTMPRRLRESESVLCRLLTGGSSNKALDVLDVGASDGTTTVELLQALSRVISSGTQGCLADLTLTLHRYRVGPFVEYRTTRGEPVLARFGMLGLRLPRSPRRLDWISTLLARLYLMLAWLRRHLRQTGTISLVNPVARSAARLEALELDILSRNDSLHAQFDVIRVSNLLSDENFTASQLQSALSNLHSYLRDGGYLLVSRNEIGRESETERGSVWRKQSEGFVTAEEFGGGSDIGRIVIAGVETG